MRVKVNSCELFMYFVVWLWSNFYSLIKLFEAQSDLLDNNVRLHNSLTDLKPGWKMISRYKDTADNEWDTWKYFYSKIWYFLIAYFIVSAILRRTSVINIQKIWYFVSSVMFIILQMGYKHFLVFITRPILHLVILLCGGKTISVWLTSLILLFIYNTEKFDEYFWDYLDEKFMNDYQVYLALSCIAWIELRCISFSVDFIQKRDQNQDADKEKQHVINKQVTYQDVINMLSYVFYLPVFYTGPIVLYEEFEKSFSVKNDNFIEKFKNFICDMILFSIYSVLLDISLHYIYFYAMQRNMQTLEQLPTIALCGGGLFMGLHFHMKYIISYGTTAAFAKLDDIDAPPTPRCISRIHIYSQMWRYFDVGLYNFLVKYIYKPCNYFISKQFNLPKMLCKLLSSLMTFIFIFIWHGVNLHIFIWSILNFIGITIEHLGKIISGCDIYNLFKTKILRSDAMETRFIAVLCTPLLILSAISNFYLFAETAVGNLFFSCFLNPSLQNSLIICLSMYCCCQVSMALEDVPSRTDKRKSNRCIL